jgi:hypothetical protein
MVNPHENTSEKCGNPIDYAGKPLYTNFITNDMEGSIMTDILKELFESPYYCGYDRTEELTELEKKLSSLWEQVTRLVGLDLVDEIYNTEAEIASIKNLQWYKEGFHLGAMLMLELLYTPSKSSF